VYDAIDRARQEAAVDCAHQEVAAA
jgi:hypothetical protein